MIDPAQAFSGFSVKDIRTAQVFYRDVLGITSIETEMGILELQLGMNPPVILYPKEDHHPADFTVLNFPVENIEQTVEELGRKGVQFEQYTGALQTDAKGIFHAAPGPKIAWFKDPSGNILSVLEA